MSLLLMTINKVVIYLLVAIEIIISFTVFLQNVFNVLFYQFSATC